MDRRKQYSYRLPAKTIEELRVLAQRLERLDPAERPVSQSDAIVFAVRTANRTLDEAKLEKSELKQARRHLSAPAD